VENSDASSEENAAVSDAESSGQPPAEPEKRNLLYLTVAYLATGLGLIGAFLPLLPTTPFLLLAAWAAAKGSPSLHRWLYEHPRFGSALIAWEQHRAVSVPAKWSACVLLVLSWIIMLYQTDGWLVPTVTGVMFVVGAAFLLTRPSA
jgi:uncharacterized membrane protein YbaN (DUF454 family)